MVDTRIESHRRAVVRWEHGIVKAERVARAHAERLRVVDDRRPIMAPVFWRDILIGLGLLGLTLLGCAPYLFG